MQDALINVNGQILAPDHAKVSVFDRSYLYGDSLYEVVRSYHGKFFRLDEHLDRLVKSAALCQMKVDQSLDFFKKEIYRTFAAFQKQKGFENTEAYLRLVVSRGTGKIGFGLKNLTTPSTYTVYVLPIDSMMPTPAQYSKGASIQISSRMRNDKRALDPAMKSGNYLNSLLAYLTATEAGFDDAIMCNADGHVAEGTTFNIWYVKRGILVSPDFEIGMLDGITRLEILTLAKKLKILLRLTRFPKERLYEADEVFLTGSFKEVFPITQLDSHKIGNGKPGPVTNLLARAYKEVVESETSS